MSPDTCINAIIDERKCLPPPTFYERFRCSEQEAGDFNWGAVTIEPPLQFTVLDEMIEAFHLDLAISGYNQQLEKPIGEITRTPILFSERIAPSL